MNVVLDTSAYSAINKGDARIMHYIAQADTIAVPSIIVGELYYGFWKGSRLQENSTILHNFLRSKRVVLIAIDGHIAERYGQLKQLQNASGQIVADNDLWIAATCVQLGFPLLTTDSDFNRIVDGDFECFGL